MHLPRDPGEWAVMVILMAVIMLAAHGARSHLTGHGAPMRPGIAMTAATWVIHRLLGVGIRVSVVGPMMLLTVRGRQSGVLRTIPIDVHDVGGRRYLIATHGVGSWVLNLRAAGEGSLSIGRRREAFTVRELPSDEAGPIVRQALGRLVASNGWRGAGLRSNLGVTQTSPDDDYARAATDHPVFEVTAKS